MEKIAVAKYFGQPGTLSSALNAYTIAGVWKKIPVVGHFQWKDDPARNATDWYYEELYRQVILGKADLNGDPIEPAKPTRNATDSGPSK